MRLIHLSDIHLSETNLIDLRNYYVEALIKDCKKFQDEKPIDIIVISGDLVDKFGYTFKNQNPYEVFQNSFLRPILNSLDFPNKRVVFNPGNHDINRNEIDPIYEAGLTQKLSGVESVNHFIQKNSDNFSLATQRIQTFKEFEREFHKDTPDYHFSCFESTFIYEKEGQKIGFLLVNDSWRCSESLKTEHHFVGTNQLFNAKNIFQDCQTDFNIAVFHHPLESFSEQERIELKNILQEFNFELVLSGHTHRSNLSLFHGVSGNFTFINSKAAFNNPRESISAFQPGYHFIDINPETLEFSCHFRAYIHSRFEFDKDTQSAPNGLFQSQLTPRSEKKKQFELFTLTNKTTQTKLEDFNSDLLVFGTETIAPKDINQLFVLPRLTENPDSFGNIDNNNQYSLSDLILDERNLILVGRRESGKTTILNRISLECSEKFNLVRKVPVILDYRDGQKKDYLTLIKGYLNETKEKIRELLSLGQILILIDNYSIGEKYKFAAKHLRDIIRDFPNAKIIATTSEKFDILVQEGQSVISTNLLKPIFIGEVGVKQFKELASKWFKSRDEEWHRTNIQKLIRAFEILRVPRTFFSISLFLWIIEKQENFTPVNKDYLLNRFLQFILEGLSIDVKGGGINFDRKKEILAEIAYKMFYEGNSINSFSLPKEKVIAVISSYFNNNQREADPIETFNLFLDRGLFKSEVTDVRFRFESFFQYFLSLNIESDGEFAKLVFSESDCLKFINEIDYYSGRNQGDKEVLLFALDILKKSFAKLDNIIEDDVDQYFPKETILLSRLDPSTFQKELGKNKLSEDEIEEILEIQVHSLPVDDSIRIKEESNTHDKFSLSLELAAKILKNAENIQAPELINEALDLIIKKSAKYGVFIQAIIVDQLSEDEDFSQMITPEMAVSLAPLIAQISLLDWIGTSFLQRPLQKKIDNYLKGKEVGEYELFLTNFIYSDLKLQGNDLNTSRSIKKIKNRYIAELFFFKIFVSYMMKSNNSGLLPKMEDQLMSLLVKAKKMSKSHARGVVENGIRNMKEESGDQLKLDL